jgi:hypothetical protein
MKRAQGSTDRGFGLMLALAFTLLGLWFVRAGGQIRVLPLVTGSVLFAVALLRPGLLRPLNRAWTKLGTVMGRAVNPVVTSALFFLVITPAGVILRLLGKDPLRLRTAPSASTYWIESDPQRSPSDTMPKQF